MVRRLLLVALVFSAVQAIAPIGPNQPGHAAEGEACYTTMGKPFTVDLEKLSGSRVNAWWHSPRDGRCYDQSGKEMASPFESIDTRGAHEFMPPTSGVDQDWVLVLDDATEDFPAPGRKRSAGP